ncbi:MAG: hypothetical protein R3F11_09090 [Verrucomicrobiales bacterium]
MPASPIHLTRAIHAPVRRLARHLGATVAIQVVADKLRVVLALPDVDAQIDPPQVRPVDLIRIQNRRPRDPGERIVQPAAGLVQHQFVVAIPIQVRHRRIAGAITVDPV